MKRLVLFLTLAAGCATVLTAGAQSIDSRLKQLFPSATSFSPKEGDPPHFTAYTGGAAKTVAGYAYWTTELLPLERGYGGPIAMLVGLDTNGRLTGVIMGEHHEPYRRLLDRPPEVRRPLQEQGRPRPFQAR